MSTAEVIVGHDFSSEQIEHLLAQVPTELYIGGQWRTAATNQTFEVVNPATGEQLAQVSDATASDALAALSAAHTAQTEWEKSTPQARADLLHALYDAVISHQEELAMVMTLEMGKSLSESRGEVVYAANFLRWYAEEALRIPGEYRRSPDGTRRILVSKRPVGPSLLITPWNFPLAMATRKLAPALAAGCTAILKPAQLTPLTALLFARLLHDVGVPAGVVNVVPTASASEITRPLLANPRLRKLSFTGSTQVGRDLLAQAAPQVLRTSMELGGNAPFIVFADANIDDAVAGAMQAKFRNIGQACTAANRFLVHESVVDEFTAQLSHAVQQLQIGDGLNSETDLGPLITPQARLGVHALVEDALRYGGELITGGRIIEGAGNYYPGTIIMGASEGSDIHYREIFGPVVSISTFTTTEQAIREANDSEYGLASYAYTQDLGLAHRLIAELQYGLIGINAGLISDASAPFGGVKQSGIGREGAAQGLEEYLETVYAGIGGIA